MTSLKQGCDNVKISVGSLAVLKLACQLHSVYEDLGEIGKAWVKSRLAIVLFSLWRCFVDQMRCSENSFFFLLHVLPLRSHQAGMQSEPERDIIAVEYHSSKVKNNSSPTCVNAFGLYQLWQVKTGQLLPIHDVSTQFSA